MRGAERYRQAPCVFDREISALVERVVSLDDSKSNERACGNLHQNMDMERDNMGFTTGGLLLRESVQVGALFRDLGDWDAVPLRYSKTFVCRPATPVARSVEAAKWSCAVSNLAVKTSTCSVRLVCRTRRTLSRLPSANRPSCRRWRPSQVDRLATDVS